jgi:hypothetical protein
MWITDIDHLQIAAPSNPASAGTVGALRKPPIPVEEALATVNKIKGGLHAQR